MEGRGGGRERKGEVDVRETDKESDRGGGGGEKEKYVERERLCTVSSHSPMHVQYQSSSQEGAKDLFLLLFSRHQPT